MKQENDLAKTFSRRALFVGGLQLGLLGILGGRLAWLQIVQGNKYQTLANKNRINLKLIAPSRGLISDRNGVLLAKNGRNYRALIVPEQTQDLEKSLSKLQKLISLSQRDIKRIVKQAARNPGFIPLEVKDNLKWDDVAKIEVNLPDLPGLSIDVGELRQYPMAESTAHIVGYVGAVSKADLAAGDPVLSLPGFKIGKTGIEKAYDKSLRGTTGTAEIEVNVSGREIRELSRNAGENGKDLQLTIDIGLQNYLRQRLSTEKSAAAVVMDTHTGAVYAMVSTPSFDPNQFTTGLSAETWEALLADPGLPLNNKVVGGQYPPGSTFKMVTALAALEEGTITRNTSVHCPGYFDYGGDRFHCWKRGGHGRMDIISAMAESCDVYFYKLATDIGIDKIAAMARRMGLGDRLGFDLSEERPGLIPDKNWKMGHFGEEWRAGETVVASIGQGYIQTTPLQLATMTARLVNGGYAVKPWMVEYIGNRPGIDTSWPKIGIKKRNLDLVLRAMDAVVNHPDGTAKGARIEQSGMKMGGKTGTSQVRRITLEERLDGTQNDNLPWNLRDHALFVGYAPHNAPRYACAVVVEHGGSGSGTAAPIARDILLMAQQREPHKIQTRPRTQSGNTTVRPPRKPKFTGRKG